ncbi:hypothetical protein JYU34_001346 [Plutella xylostella]|uniref:Uncharacterized protein n=1 Tax=Plutella xylostella TaxID=51655 RepID=A0ABQ7R3S9_PLUXY|nr:hypothetical protein JYU34_001346 [Plutella xylostella]
MRAAVLLTCLALAAAGRCGGGSGAWGSHTHTQLQRGFVADHYHSEAVWTARGGVEPDPLEHTAAY